MTTRSERYDLIDTIRGIAIVSMVIFHFCYDMFMIYGRDLSWYGQPIVHIWQQSICWTFIVVSGFAWSWGSQGNLKRGIILNIWGLIITGVTVLVMPADAVWFGILNCIGCAVLLMIPLAPLLRRIPAIIGALLALMLFLVCKNVQLGYLGFGGVLYAVLPRWLYECRVLTPFGFPFPGFRSSDYFPILPWLFLYICGYFLNRVMMSSHSLQSAAHHGVAPLSAIGRYSIWIYLAHQPICMLVCMALFG